MWFSPKGWSTTSMTWLASWPRHAGFLEPDGSLVVLDAEPMPEDDYRAMCDQLRASGAAPEPRNGVDPGSLDALVRLGGDGVVTSLAAGTCARHPAPRRA